MAWGWMEWEVLEKEMAEDKSATREKVERKKFFDECDDFETSKTPKRERRKPKHLENFYLSEQAKGKASKKTKVKKTLAAMFSGRRNVNSSI